MVGGDDAASEGERTDGGAASASGEGSAGDAAENTDEATGGPAVDGSASKLTCFVIGPIGNRHGAHGSSERDVYEESLRVMEEVIKPACARVGLTPVRADSLARAGEITEQIF